MGNYRFRLSDMMPNSWFYKLRDMGRASSRGQSIQHQHTSKRIQHQATKATTTTTKEAIFSPQPNQVYIPNRPSYYFSSKNQTNKPSISPSHPKASDSHFPIVFDPPRKSKKRPRKRPTSPSSISKPVSNEVCVCSPTSTTTTDIIIEDDFLLHHLPRILTKPKEPEKRVQQHGIKVRPSSPKIEIKRAMQSSNSRRRRVVSSKRLSESFVVVKKSADPKRDFRESMVEMIMEHDIRGSRDLEELLACYLSLNSVEYHDLIVKVFEDIWVHLK